MRMSFIDTAECDLHFPVRLTFLCLQEASGGPLGARRDLAGPDGGVCVDQQALARANSFGGNEK